MKEGESKYSADRAEPSTASVIDLRDFSAETIKLVFEHPWEKMTPEQLVDLYMLVDFLGIEGLKDNCISMLAQLKNRDPVTALITAYPLKNHVPELITNTIRMLEWKIKRERNSFINASPLQKHQEAMKLLSLEKDNVEAQEALKLYQNLGVTQKDHV